MKNLLLLFLVIIIYAPNAYNQTFGDTLSKKEKRFIHPESKYFSFAYGLGFNSISTKDPNNFLTQGLQMRNNSKLPSLIYEHGIGNNFFFEMGYTYLRQGVFYGRQVNTMSFSRYYSFFSNHNIQLGIGYRVINKNNFHFFDLHGGIFMGIPNKKIKNLPIVQIDNYEDYYTTNKYSIFLSVNHISSLSLGTYFGISKEIRLSKDVFFFIKYIQQFGIKPLISGTLELSSSQIDFVDEPVTYKVRGGGAFVIGGLKIQLFKNQ